MSGVSLTALAAMRAKMTPGEYKSRGVSLSTDGRTLAVLNSTPSALSVGHTSGGTDSDGQTEFAIGRATAAGLVATHNAADVLIEVARAAKAYLADGDEGRERRLRMLRDALAKVSL